MTTGRFTDGEDPRRNKGGRPRKGKTLQGMKDMIQREGESSISRLIAIAKDDKVKVVDKLKAETLIQGLYKQLFIDPEQAKASVATDKKEDKPQGVTPSQGSVVGFSNRPLQ